MKPQPLPYGAARLVSRNSDEDCKNAYRARPSTALAGPRFELQYHSPGSAPSSSSKDENMDGLVKQRKNRLFPSPIIPDTDISSSNSNSYSYSNKDKVVHRVQIQSPPPPPNPPQLILQQPDHPHYQQPPPTVRPKSAGPSYRAAPTNRANATVVVVNSVEPIIPPHHHRADTDIVNDDGKAQVRAQGLGNAVDHPEAPSKHGNNNPAARKGI